MPNPYWAIYFIKGKWHRIVSSKDLSGRYVYVPEPDEKAIREGRYFIDSLSLALLLREQHKGHINTVRLQYISTETFIKISPEWLTDTI